MLIFLLLFVYKINSFNFPIIYTGSYDKTAKVWDLISGKCVKTINALGPVKHFNYYDKETNFLSTTSTAELIMNNPEETFIKVSNDWIITSSISPCGTYISTINSKKTLKIIETKELIKKHEIILENKNYVNSILYSSFNKFLVIYTLYEIFIYDLNLGILVKSINLNYYIGVIQMYYHKFNDYLMIGGVDGRIRVMDMDGNFIYLFTNQRGLISSISINKNIMASSCLYGSVYVYDLDKIIFENDKNDRDYVLFSINNGKNGLINSVSLSNENNFLILGDYQGRIQIYDVNTGAKIKEFQAHNSTITSIEIYTYINDQK